MKKQALRGFVLLVTIFALSGCDEFLTGAGAGLATAETIQSWQENLQAKQVELQERYAEVLTELEAAPDPNAIRTAKEKLRVIQDQQLANEASLLTVKTILDAKGSEGKERTDAIATGLLGALALAYREWSRRKLQKKNAAFKAGQAEFTREEPEAASKLYAIIGKARNARGVT